jgi:hypothetical protein
MPRIDDAIETIGSFILRTLVTIYHAVEVCAYGRNPTYETISWTLYDKDGYNSSFNTFHELDIGREHSLFIAHDVRRTIGFQQTQKVAIHWVEGAWRTPYELSDLFSLPPPPWLYIGFGESPDALTDCTEDLNCLVVYDNRVTPDVLAAIVPASEGKTWFYINPKTFEMAEFPAEGILIDDPPLYSEDQPEPSTKDD